MICFRADELWEDYLYLAIKNEKDGVLQLFIGINNCFSLLNIAHIKTVKKLSLILFRQFLKKRFFSQDIFQLISDKDDRQALT